MSYSLYLLTLYPLDNNAYVTILSPRCREILKISWIIPSSWAYLLSPYADVLLLKSLRLLWRVTTETQLRRSANFFHLKPNLRMVLTCFSSTIFLGRPEFLILLFVVFSVKDFHRHVNTLRIAQPIQQFLE